MSPYQRDQNERGIDRHFSDTRKLFQALPPGFKIVALDKTTIASMFNNSQVELGYGTYIVAAQKI